jgi:hypothetical protein
MSPWDIIAIAAILLIGPMVVLMVPLHDALAGPLDSFPGWVFILFTWLWLHQSPSSGGYFRYLV